MVGTARENSEVPSTPVAVAVSHWPGRASNVDDGHAVAAVIRPKWKVRR